MVTTISLHVFVLHQPLSIRSYNSSTEMCCLPRKQHIWPTNASLKLHHNLPQSRKNQQTHRKKDLLQWLVTFYAYQKALHVRFFYSSEWSCWWVVRGWAGCISCVFHWVLCVIQESVVRQLLGDIWLGTWPTKRWYTIQQSATEIHNKAKCTSHTTNTLHTQQSAGDTHQHTLATHHIMHTHHFKRVTYYIFKATHKS